MPNKTTETWITIEMGDGARRNMPKRKWHEAQKNSQWLIETALKAGYTQQEAEELFSVWIVKEYETPIET